MAATLPPIHINQKTVKDNSFSKHDNRHAFQDSGVYFGQGLGKRVVWDGRNQHRSDNHISWSSTPPELPHFSSTYQIGYSRQPVHRRSHTSPAALSGGAKLQLNSATTTLNTDRTLLAKFHICTKPNFRHFPRKHSLPGDVPLTKLPTDTTNWGCVKKQQQGGGKGKKYGAGGEGFTTPLSVLAATQQPFLDHNPWTYSYKK